MPWMTCAILRKDKGLFQQQSQPLNHQTDSHNLPVGHHRHKSECTLNHENRLAEIRLRFQHIEYNFFPAHT
jgi:hypothetical protein